MYCESVTVIFAEDSPVPSELPSRANWSSVSDEYDVVHLTAMAYPSTAGCAFHCHNGATGLAG
jgi:hypothetical protein